MADELDFAAPAMVTQDMAYKAFRLGFCGYSTGEQL